MSKKNPFGAIEHRSSVLATEMKFGGNGSRLVANDGEINASSSKDLQKIVAAMMGVAKSTHIETEAGATSKAVLAKAHKEAITAAFTDKQAHKELGEVMAQELYQAANREGFMRRFLARQELAQGTFPQIRMRNKDMVAIVSSSPSKIQSQIIRDKLFFPPEFYISARPFIEQREINQSVGDVLEEKYIEGLEGIMVQEDRTFINMAIASINVSNPLTAIVGTLNPTGLATLRNQVTRWDIPVAGLLIANDLWNDIIGDTGFSQLIDQVSKHELLLTGQLGTIVGMGVFSDAFRHPQHKVLNQGDLYVFGDPVNTGIYTDRGGVDSQPIDGSIEQVPGRGWWLTESVSMVIANSRAVAKATRH
jgi:hypothetical protein